MGQLPEFLELKETLSKGSKRGSGKEPVEEVKRTSVKSSSPLVSKRASMHSVRSVKSGGDKTEAQRVSMESKDPTWLKRKESMCNDD